MALTNWAGNYTFSARVVHRPETVQELCAVLASADRVRVLGSRHSFTDIAAGYGRASDFAILARRLDPRGAFTNRWLRERLLDGLS